jgi:hypothetical protein
MGIQYAVRCGSTTQSIYVVRAAGQAVYSRLKCCFLSSAVQLIRFGDKCYEIKHKGLSFVIQVIILLEICFCNYPHIQAYTLHRNYNLTHCYKNTDVFSLFENN